ncbi:MAG: nickel/cobalt transporter [Pseudooceanicola sp.]
MSESTVPPPARARLWALLPGACLLGLALWLFAFGGMADLSRWAAAGQRDVQNAMAGGLRGLKGGQAGAFAGLMGLCFAYGVFHAAGPGHGKLLIGGLGLAGRGTARRLAWLALWSSLGQGVTAVILVWAGFALFGWGREAMTSAAETAFAPASWGAIAAIGVWLVWRATWRLVRLAPARGAGPGHAPDDGAHDHHDHDAHCGHRHGPSVEDAARATTLREALALVAAIAIRPCTGALFLLAITYGMGLFPAGVAGTFAMALGTAGVTVAVALFSSTLHRTTLGPLAAAMSSAAAARVAALVEGAAGAIIAAVALSLLSAAL